MRNFIITLVLSLLGAVNLHAQHPNYPANAQYYEATDAVIETGREQFLFEKLKIDDGWKVAGFTGPAHEIIPTEEGFFSVEGPGIREFQIAPDGTTVTQVGSHPLWSLNRKLGAPSRSAIWVPQIESIVTGKLFEAAPNALFSRGVRSTIFKWDTEKSEPQYVGSYRIHANAIPRFAQYSDPNDNSSRTSHMKTVALLGGIESTLVVNVVEPVLAIVDVATETPRLRSWVNLGSPPSVVEIRGDYLYALLLPDVVLPDGKPRTSYPLVAIVNVSDPDAIFIESLTQMASIRAGNAGYSPTPVWEDVGMDVHEDILYLYTTNADSVPNPGQESLNLWDVGDSANPEHIATHSITEDPRILYDGSLGFAIIDSKLFMTGRRGFQVFDLSDPENIISHAYPHGYGTHCRGNKLIDSQVVNGHLIETFEVKIIVDDVEDNPPNKYKYDDDEIIYLPPDSHVHPPELKPRMTVLYDLSGDTPEVLWERPTAAIKYWDGDHAYGYQRKIVVSANLTDPQNPHYTIGIPDANQQLPGSPAQFGSRTGQESRIGAGEGEEDFLLYRDSTTNESTFALEHLAGYRFYRAPHLFVLELDRGDTPSILTTYVRSGVDEFTLVDTLEIPTLVQLDGLQLPTFESLTYRLWLGEEVLVIRENRDDRDIDLALIDISDPANLRHGARIRTTRPGGPTDFWGVDHNTYFGIYGGYLYASSSINGPTKLVSWDISDVHAPLVVNSIDYPLEVAGIDIGVHPGPLDGYTHDPFRGMWMSGSEKLYGEEYVHVVVSQGLKPDIYSVLDMSDPFDPSVVAHSNVIGSYTHNDSFNGKYYLGFYNYHVADELRDTLILEPTFIDFPPVHVYPSPDSHQFAWQAGSALTQIEMDRSTVATQWTAGITEGTAWLTMIEDHADILPSTSGGRAAAGSLTFEYEANHTPFSRNAQIHLKAASPNTVTSTIALQQDGLQMVITPLEVDIEPEGGDTTVTVDIGNLPMNWYVSIEGEPTWCTIPSSKSGAGNGAVALEIQENVTEHPRVAMVRVWTDMGHEKTVTIRQRSYVPGELAASPAVVRCDSALQFIEVDVVNIGETDIPWLAKALGGNWVDLVSIPSVEPVRHVHGANTQTLTLMLRENNMSSQRRAVLEIQPIDDSLPSIFVPIVQEGAFALTDTNRDGKVTSADIQTVINAVTNGDNSCDCADINGDGLVNSLDIQAVINAVLGMKALQ